MAADADHDAPHEPAHRDPNVLRQAVAAALAAGTPPQEVYATVVRPILLPYADAATERQPGGGQRALARSMAHAALAELVGAHPGSTAGQGRAAVVLVPPGLLGELDAHVLGDALEAAGWIARLLGLARPLRDVLAMAHDAEVILVPAGDPGEILAAAEACAALGETSPPPLIVGVTFTAAGTDPLPAPALALDDRLDGTDALVPLLRRRLGGAETDAAR